MMLGNSSTTGSESVHSTLYDMTLSIKKKLAGSGGCGSVYVGIYGGKPIVAKVPTLNKHEELIHKELLVMKMLGPNDFTVQLVGYLDGVNILLPDDPNQIPRSALLLERMSLGTLSQYMKRRPNAKIRTEIYDLVFSERHAIALSASKGIEYIHKKNLVHLDIKAENILLNIVEKPTKKLIAKISDFGSTRRNGTTDSVFQTPGYVPPESKRSREKTFKYDSFAFGCVLIHMLTGENYPYMWHGKNISLKEKQTILTSTNAPKDLISLILKCLDDDPSVRPTSSEIVLKITELGASLFAILSSPAVLGSSVQDFPDTVLSVQPYTKNAKIRSRIESTGGYTAGHFIFESLEIKGATSPWNEFSQKFVTTFHSGNKFDADVLRTSVGPLANQVTLSRLNKKLFASIPPKNTENESGMWEEEVLEVVENLVQKCSTSPSATFVERPNMNSTNVSFLDPLLPPRPPMMPNSFDPPLPPRSPMSPLSMDSRPMSPNFNGSPMNSTYNGFNSSVRPGNLNFSNDLNVNNDFNFSNGPSVMGLGNSETAHSTTFPVKIDLNLGDSVEDRHSRRSDRARGGGRGGRNRNRDRSARREKSEKDGEDPSLIVKMANAALDYYGYSGIKMDQNFDFHVGPNVQPEKKDEFNKLMTGYVNKDVIKDLAGAKNDIEDAQRDISAAKEEVSTAMEEGMKEFAKALGLQFEKDKHAIKLKLKPGNMERKGNLERTALLQSRSNAIQSTVNAIAKPSNANDPQSSNKNETLVDSSKDIEEFDSFLESQITMNVGDLENDLESSIMSLQKSLDEKIRRTEESLLMAEATIVAPTLDFCDQLDDLSKEQQINILERAFPNSPADYAVFNNEQLVEINMTVDVKEPKDFGITSTFKIWAYDRLKVHGLIPAVIGQFSHMTKLFLGNNKFSGPIPVELFKLLKLTHLDLHDNQLSGSIPAELGNLKELIFLALNGNKLTGNIPKEIGNLKSLITLDLSSNKLTGDIPPEISLTNINSLSLVGNQLNGRLQKANLPNVTELILDDQNF